MIKIFFIILIITSCDRKSEQFEVSDQPDEFSGFSAYLKHIDLISERLSRIFYDQPNRVNLKSILGNALRVSDPGLIGELLTILGEYSANGIDVEKVNFEPSDMNMYIWYKVLNSFARTLSSLCHPVSEREREHREALSSLGLSILNNLCDSEEFNYATYTSAYEAILGFESDKQQIEIWANYMLNLPVSEKREIFVSGFIGATLSPFFLLER